MSAQARRREVALIAIPVVGWLVTLLYAYPGIVTWDGLQLLAEARGGIYADDHPPVYIAIWHVIDAVAPGSAGMLVVQTALFVLGLVLLCRRFFTPLTASVVATAIAVFPPVAVPMAAIWKDSLMAGLLAIGIAAALARSRRWLVVAAIALCAATAIRYNAAAATLAPIAVADWVPSWRGMRRYAAAIAIWLVVTAVAFEANELLTDKHMYAWASLVAPGDIVGTIAHVDEPIADADLVALLDGTELLVTHDIQAAARAIYDPRDGLRATAELPGAFWHVPFYDPLPESRRAAFSRAWCQLVTAHPLAYAEHRWDAFAAALGRSDSAVTWRGHDPRSAAMREQLGVVTDWPRGQRLATHALQQLERATPLFVPWVYLVIAVLIAPLALRRRDTGALLASAILYDGTLLLLASSADYRYSHWMITATVVTVVALVARRLRVTA